MKSIFLCYNCVFRNREQKETSYFFEVKTLSYCDHMYCYLQLLIITTYWCVHPFFYGMLVMVFFLVTVWMMIWIVWIVGWCSWCCWWLLWYLYFCFWHSQWPYLLGLLYCLNALFESLNWYSFLETSDTFSVCGWSMTDFARYNANILTIFSAGDGT